MRSPLLPMGLLGFALGCAPVEDAAEKPVRIFAAASLTDSLGAVIADFQKVQPPTHIVSHFGGSSTLARQIIAGAPADLFLSADRRQLERVASEGLIEKGARADILSNELVVVRHRDQADAVNGPASLGELGRIAMADPEAVPAGVYARRYLESRGLWAGLRSRVVPTLDVRGALAAVASGSVDAGFVYRTDAAIEERVKVVYTVIREEGPPIVYSLGIVGARARPEARRFYDYLRSEAAGEVFERFGFVFLESGP